MSDERVYCVLTTIQPPTACVMALLEVLDEHSVDLIVVGDRKGPSEWPTGVGRLYDIEAQVSTGFSLAARLPENHYVRKNIGYLLAMRAGADVIYEIDDDNRPLPSWRPRPHEVSALDAAPREWVNVYRHFSPESLIWPRGFPLRMIHGDAAVCDVGERSASLAPIQQGLADGSPDVDAIWRLVLDKEHHFGQAGDSVRLPQGTWCPFNSQSTWWRPEAYPLMYLPASCSFRMTDILRGFIAQRCLWALGSNLVFHSAEVFQERNEHDLIRDLEDEVSGYLGNERMCRVLEGLELDPGPGAVASNLRRCYSALIAEGFFAEWEAGLVDAWLVDLEGITGE